jgi:hypothetical protein
MVAEIQHKGVKVAQQSVAAGAGETALLAAYIQGSRRFGSNNLSVGDVIILRAWGKYTTTPPSLITLRIRQYLHNNPVPNGLVADIQLAPPQSGTREWHFHSMLTIRGTGTNGILYCDYCDGRFIVPGNPDGFAGLNATVAINTTVDNDLELTVTLTVSGTFFLEQCSIAKLPRP